MLEVRIKRKREESAGAGQAEKKDKQLYDAARKGETATVTRFLAAGADPNGHKDRVRACARAASLPAAPGPLHALAV